MKKLYLSIISFLLLSFIVYKIVYYQQKNTIKTKITGKEYISKGSGDALDSYYLIYTEDGAFILDDDIFYGNFRSSDWYGNIKIDSTYTFKIIGLRIGFISEYPKIVKYE